VAVRGFVVPMLIGMASTSSSTRAKLWACNGIDIFLQLLGEEVGAVSRFRLLKALAFQGFLNLNSADRRLPQPSTPLPSPQNNQQDAQMQVGLLRALDTWLAEDHARVEHRLVAREAVAQLVALVGGACGARDMATMPHMLDTLKLMLGRWVSLVGLGWCLYVCGYLCWLCLLCARLNGIDPPAPAHLPRTRRTTNNPSLPTQVRQAVGGDGDRRPRPAAARAPRVPPGRRRPHPPRATA
jgi:hypothetical protein